MGVQEIQYTHVVKILLILWHHVLNFTQNSYKFIYTCIPVILYYEEYKATAL